MSRKYILVDTLLFIPSQALILKRQEICQDSKSSGVLYAGWQPAGFHSWELKEIIIQPIHNP
jgi:hypothetical protein